MALVIVILAKAFGNGVHSYIEAKDGTVCVYEGGSNYSEVGNEFGIRNVVALVMVSLVVLA